MGECLCDSCAALCCRYFALPIDNPETKKDFDNVRWYLIHQNVVVFVEKSQWYIGIFNRCKHLQDDNRCGIYETRPMICRTYSTDNCDYHGGDYGYELLFTSGEGLWEYATKRLREERSERQKKAARAKRRKEGVSNKKPSRKARRPSLKPMILNRGTNGTGLVKLTANGRGLSLPLLRS